MAGVLVHCDHCGHTGPVRGFIGDFKQDRPVEVHMSRSAWPCPNCNRQARVLDGVFEFRDDVIEVLAAPGWTRAKLLELEQALRDAQHLAAKDIGAAVTRLAEVDRRTAGLLLRQVAGGKSTANVLQLLMLMVAIATAIIMVRTADQELSVEDVQRIVDQQIHQQQNEEPPKTKREGP